MTIDKLPEYKLCVDCKHYVREEKLRFTEDGHACSYDTLPRNYVPVDLVTGQPKAPPQPYYFSARIMRNDYIYCGKDAKWFEPK
jgi:hypothetical protein